MRAIFFVFLICIVNGLVATPSHSTEGTFGGTTAKPDSPVLAMWSNENTVPVIWVYGKPSTCPETRREAKSVLMIVPTRRLKDGELFHFDAIELPLCLERLWNGEAVICRSGLLRLQYFVDKQEYLGDYDFKMNDGTNRSMAFRAKYCPVPSSP